MSQNPQYNQSRQGRSSANWGNVFTRKLSKNHFYLKILLPYLHNPFEEDKSESIYIKEQHETKKLLNKEVTSAKAPKKKTKQTSARETFQKKLFVLLYTDIDTVEIFYTLHDKVARLSWQFYERGIRNCQKRPNNF